MPYHISRNGQTYGPYTLEDLERYVVSGHVLLSDLCKDDAMTDWLPVSQVLANAGRPPSVASAPGTSGSAVYPPMSYAATPSYAARPGYAPGASVMTPPPNLHWGLVLLFDVLTCSLFQMVWNIILGAWFHRIVPTSKTLILYIAAAVLLICQGVGGQAMGIVNARGAAMSGNPYSGYTHHTGLLGLYGLIALVCWVVRLIARFNFRSELELHYNTVEPIGLQINPVLLFFFGGIYLQSVLNRINETRRILAYGAVPR